MNEIVIKIERKNCLLIFENIIRFIVDSDAERKILGCPY